MTVVGKVDKSFRLSHLTEPNSTAVSFNYRETQSSGSHLHPRNKETA
jgi:hypothetical protein